MLVDTHCHLQDERIINKLGVIMDRAHAAGVNGFLCCGSAVSDWQSVLEISCHFPGVIPAFGVHPWYVDNLPDHWLETLKKFLQKTPSAIGEIGLDTKFTQTAIEKQVEVCEIQLQLAQELCRPVSMHCVKAWHYLFPLLKKYNHPQSPVQIHSYGGGPALIDQLLEYNVYFSFSGSLTRSKNQKSHQSIKKIPANRLLIETDSPDIPLEINGKIDFNTPNEPSNLSHVLNQAAHLLEMRPDLLVNQLIQNTARFLGSLSTHH